MRNRDYAHGVIHTLLAVGCLLSIFTATLTYLNLMTLAALSVLGAVLMVMWGVSLIVWAFWG